MLKVSVNILTKNRAESLRTALASTERQSFRDFEIVVINDGSKDNTLEMLDSNFGSRNHLKIISHQISKGITISRQEALEASNGQYIAILDDDDEWADKDKLKKQTEFLDTHPEYVLVGGGINISNIKYQITQFRPKTDEQIRNWMLIKNPFFTSTVMFRKEAALKAAGFVKDSIDLGEDYDLWLRLGKAGKMYNFQEPFTLYSKSNYNRGKLRMFLKKQLNLVERHKHDYSYAFIAKLILLVRYVLPI